LTRRARTGLGTATQCTRRNDLKAGIRSYKRALTYAPRHADAYYNLGVAYAEGGKIAKAILHYELAYNFNPGHFEACNNLGVIYRELDNWEMTMRWYQQALSVHPTYFQTHNNLSILYTMQGAASVASLLAAILAEIYLCNVCSCQEILRRNGRE
jgi:tetratricopeptide (TPR) repeat protein